MNTWMMLMKGPTPPNSVCSHSQLNWKNIVEAINQNNIAEISIRQLFSSKFHSSEEHKKT